MLAQGQERGAFRLKIGREAFPLRAANGAEENGLGVAATLKGVRGEGVAKLVDAGAAHGVVLGVEGEAELLGGGVKDVETDGHDFRSDAVAREDGDFVGVAHKGGFRDCRSVGKNQTGCAGRGEGGRN